ncbi:MAG: SOS response-associated peptidase [Pyrinomonadaceae bacterium]
MCGRFTLKAPKKVIAKQFGVRIEDELVPHYNIAPTQTVAAIRLAQGGEGMEFIRLDWGLIPSWAKDTTIASKLINARSETLSEKPSFREALKRRRCLIVADGFFEWDKKGKTKQPYYFQLKDGLPFAFAGLWERWAGHEEGGVETCTIITTTPNELLAQVHDRMPVILPPEVYSMWLDEEVRNGEMRKELLSPYPSSEMIAYPVSRQVNSPQNNSERLIRELKETTFV